MTSSVRFFTSASLRPQEEVPGEVAQWLPRWITVEYDRGRPISGVWQSAAGARRICWYAAADSADIVVAHLERYGDEPFWIVDVSDEERRCVRIIDCDGSGKPLARRAWFFDGTDMPVRVDEHAPDGSTLAVRTYRSMSDRTVVASTEQRAGGASIDIPRPIEFPCSELAGEPYPCGGTITTGGPRLVAPIMQNWYQGRLLAVFQVGTEWRRGLATISTSRGWPATMRQVLDFRADGVAPMVTYGELIEPRRQGYTAYGVVEELPDGRTLEEVVRERTLSPAETVSIAMQIARVAQVAHAAGHQLGGIRPELVYVRRDGEQWSLVAITHRAQAVIDATYSGEAICTPPVFSADFSSANDAQGLAQLVWHALTGGHPYVAAADFARSGAWYAHRTGRAPRQPWTGPAEFGAALEFALREPTDPGRFARFVGELAGLG